MSERSRQLLQEVLALDVSERAEVAARLIDSLDPDQPDPDYVEQWDREIERRLKEIESAAVQPVAWEGARRSLRQGYEDGQAG